MSTDPWLWPALLAVSLWGISAFIPKLAVRWMGPLHLMVYGGIFSMMAAVVMLAFNGFHLDFEARAVLIAAAVGMLGRLGSILYVMALRDAPVSYVTVVTSLYPIVAAVLSYMILHEELSLRQAAGMMLGIFSLILLVKSNDFPNKA